MLPPEGFSYGLPHHTPPSHPREPREAARTSPKNKKNPFPSPPHSQHRSPPAQDEVWRVQKKGAGTKYSWGGQRFIFHPLERAKVYFPPLSKAANTPLFMFTPSICTPPFCSLLLHSQCLQRPRAGFAVPGGLWCHQSPQHGVSQPRLCHPAVPRAGSSPSRTRGWGQQGACRVS